MAFGFGPGANMQNDYNRNRSMLGKRKSLSDIAVYKSNETTSFNESKLNEEEMEAFRTKLKRERARRDKKEIAFVLVSAIILALVFYLIWF